MFQIALLIIAAAVLYEAYRGLNNDEVTSKVGSIGALVFGIILLLFALIMPTLMQLYMSS